MKFDGSEKYESYQMLRITFSFSNHFLIREHACWNVGRKQRFYERFKIWKAIVVQNGKMFGPFSIALVTCPRIWAEWRKWSTRKEGKRYKVLSETRVETGTTSMSRRNVWHEEFFKAWRRVSLVCLAQTRFGEFDLTSSRKIWLKNHRKPFRSAEPFTPRS